VKDPWWLTLHREEAVKTPGYWTTTFKTEDNRMLSRIADSLFWLNRYMERSEGMLRVLHTNYILSFDSSAYGVHSWRPVLTLFTSADEEKIKSLEFQTSASLFYLIADTKNTNSLKVLVGKARENARGIQDNITKEVWEQVNQMYHFMNDPSLEEKIKSDNVLPLIDALIQQTILFAGITDTTMPRGIGWSFMNLGRFTERCLLTVQMAKKQFEGMEYDLSKDRDILYWRILLLCLSGYEHHLKTYRSTSATNNVVDQIILDKQFPRSIKYSLNRIEKYLQDVVLNNQSSEAEQLRLEFSRFNSRVQFADNAYLQNNGVKQFLDHVQTDIYQFSNQLGQVFFSYT
jgi:uncharacterized alpha-E superfamily protein